jgi:ribonuclease BN (tRNA processing enzyme)
MLLECIQQAKSRLAKLKRLAKNVDGFVEKSSCNHEIKSKYAYRGTHGMSKQVHEEGKILLIASDNLLKYYEFASCISGLDSLVTFYPISRTLYAGNTNDISAATSGVLCRIQSIPVYHCQHSYGCVIEFSSGNVVVYSGDCRFVF